MYSDEYFRRNQSLNAIIKNLNELTQFENNILVGDEPNPNILQQKHLAIYELRKTVEYEAVLRDLYLQYDYDISVPAFRAKCFELSERNVRSYRNYVPIIRVEKIDTYEQFFYVKKYDEVVSRIAHSNPKVKSTERVVLSSYPDYYNNDLDRITPVKYKKDYINVPTSERDVLRLSSLSVHELEDILLKRKGTDKHGRVKVRSLEDVRLGRAYPMLEPLILKEDEYDSEKIRLRISEHKKIVRITIAYTLAFFILVIITFFIIYYA